MTAVSRTAPPARPPLPGPPLSATPQLLRLMIADRLGIESDDDDGSGGDTGPSTGISVLAGDAVTGGNVNKKGTAARFNTPRGLALDTNGNVYVADEGNFTIRKIAPDGTVTTFAGLAGASGTTDAKGDRARFTQPTAVTIDGNGDLYVLDGAAIRKITADGTVSTIAGSGINGYQDGGASEAQFNNPCGTAVDKNGNVYVSERNGHNIRKITPDGVVSTYARKDNGSGGNELTSVIVHPITGDIIWSDFYGDAIWHLDANGNVSEVVHHS